MKVLVAGATGNTGQRLVRELNDRGLNPVAMVRDSSDTCRHTLLGRASLNDECGSSSRGRAIYADMQSCRHVDLQ